MARNRFPPAAIRYEDVSDNRPEDSTFTDFSRACST